MRLAKSIVGTLEAEAVQKVLLDDGFLGMGQEVVAFEKDLADYLGHREVEEVVCVSSGTAALHLAIAATCQAGDEVLVPSFTYVASFQAISGAGAVPIACDIRSDNGQIDLYDAEAKLSPKTKVIMPVYYAGDARTREPIFEFAKEYRLRVVEDAAHAFGSFSQKKKVGETGDVTCFSFDGIKNITSGEGGAVVSSDKTILERIRDTRLLGVVRDSEKRGAGKRSWDFDVLHQGYRYHMSNLMAAIGRVQLKRFETEFVKKRQELVRHYHACLGQLTDIEWLTFPDKSIVPHLCVIKCMSGERDRLRKYLSEVDIETGIHYKPNHLLSLYRQPNIHCPKSEQLYRQVLSLPLHPELTETDIETVCNRIVHFYGR